MGALLRHRRTAAGRTIASVAAEAGLSVPYIANLENGRGNPTLSAVSSLASALGARLTVSLTDNDDGDPLPESLVGFARGARFQTEVTRLGVDRAALLAAMAATGSLAGRPLTDLDWHRILDTITLINLLPHDEP
ncbi:helix-turn-helix domain-containing protein [Actinoplanes couchii]|uniref:HTH cro/C1-type domain-containing protein n=1 Tax=Actinoplanes couchii TaxID=403638 RepID=A0ABQ3XNG5_9ACTN|nr:helix-turn-helix transcriptional regulator [Actinoplanes couchii]GID60046.1 hypothetical protein Aco03nite_084500 [Actinoplanes couchii]